MEEAVLSINNLTKHFGRVKAVQQLSLDVQKGNIYGILGPNGSGKTTTLGMILGVINPSAGDFYWFGKPPSHHSRKRIGAILEQPIFYPYFDAVRNLRLVSRIKQADAPDIDTVLKTVGLYDRRHSKFRTFSYGMRQRLALGSALLCHPEVLILDEPTNGLDPQGIADVRSLILEVASQGITIILASHLLDEVQKICTHVAVLESGKKLFSGNVAEVLNDSLFIEVSAENMETLKIAIDHFDKVQNYTQEGDKLLVTMKQDTNPGDLNSYLFAKGITATHLMMRKKTLEKYFLELLKKS